MICSLGVLAERDVVHRTPGVAVVKNYIIFSRDLNSFKISIQFKPSEVACVRSF